MKHTYLFFTALLSIIVSSCTEHPDKSQEAQEKASRKIYTATAKVKTSSKEILLTGKVTTDPDRTIHYLPLSNGVVTKTYFVLGEKVSKDQVLLDFKSNELSALQAEQISLHGEFTLAQRDLKTAESMYNDQIISEKELIESQNKVRQLQASLARIDADMSVYGSSLENGVFSIKAPTGGYIIAKSASGGSTVTTEGAPLFSIANLDQVWVMANVYTSNIANISEGTSVEITSVAYPDQVFHGKISHLAQVFDSEDKSLKARIILDNPDLKLKPEMSVIVKVQQEMTENYISVPSDALIFDDNKYFVVVKNEEALSIREVTPASQSNKQAYLSEGLNQGEEVVIKHQLLIYSGLKEI